MPTVKGVTFGGNLTFMIRDLMNKFNGQKKSTLHDLLALIF